MNSLTVTKRIRKFRLPCLPLKGSCNQCHPPESNRHIHQDSRYHSRTFSNDSNDGNSEGSRIPKPTWSIQELDLTSKRPPLPEEELDRLSKLALIDIKAMPPNVQESLGQDLANMLHMIDQVTQYSSDDGEDTNSSSVEEDIQTAAEIYDLVRGVTKAPLRKSAEQDHFQAEDDGIAKDVWENMLQPKTKRMGGRHEYFAIQTKTGTTDE